MASETRIKIAPSILSADFGRLAEQVAEAEHAGADYVHVDIMDGHFVPNITMGPLVVSAVRRATSLPLDVHMMVASPERYVEEFVDAGADIITVHVEACTHLHRVVHQIRESGAKAGAALNPATPPSAVEEVLADLDQVLVMTVNPGFGGQAFIHDVVDKIRRVRARLDARGLPVDLEVDGGISAATARTAVDAGARVLVAGSAIYNDNMSVDEAIAQLRVSIDNV